MLLVIFSVAIIVSMVICFRVESDSNLAGFDKSFCLYFAILCGGYFAKMLFFEIF